MGHLSCCAEVEDERQVLWEALSTEYLNSGAEHIQTVKKGRDVTTRFHVPPQGFVPVPRPNSWFLSTEFRYSKCEFESICTSAVLS